MRMKLIKRLSFVVASLLALIIFIKMNDDLSNFFYATKLNKATLTFSTVNATVIDKDKLREQIEQEAKRFNEPPLNAYIDPIFHAVPGYNGKIIDVEATYTYNVNLTRVEKIHYFYKEIEPEVHLDHLGLQPIYKGNPNKKMVAYMVNVAWGNNELIGMLDILKKENVKLTFFLDGMWLKENKQLALRIIEEGHELGNHAYSHPDMSKLSRSKQYEQIKKTNELLAEINIVPKWFAPPSGYFNQSTIEVAKDFNMHTVLWTVDTIDWQNPQKDLMIKRVSNKLVPGTLVLMHPKQVTMESLSELIQMARDKGYEVGTVSETLSTSRERKEVVSPILF